MHKFLSFKLTNLYFNIEGYEIYSSKSFHYFYTDDEFSVINMLEHIIGYRKKL